MNAKESIYKLRNLRGFSVEEIAKAIDIHPRNVQRLAAGHVDGNGPTVRLLWLLTTCREARRRCGLKSGRNIG